MAIHLATAPCCWGVDDPTNPFLPPWRRVLSEAAQAGFRGIELGPYGYLPTDPEELGDALREHHLCIVAGTLFDDLLTPANQPRLLAQARAICRLLGRLPANGAQPGHRHRPPYLVLIDWGHTERDYAAGHTERAPRLAREQWRSLMAHIRDLARLAWEEHGVRAVVHPHAGGYIEFADELARLVDDIPDTVAGLCLDTGHLHYASMDPVATLRHYAHRLDYLHFKDIDPEMFDHVLSQRIRFFEACAQGVMCPIGQGGIDYPALHALLGELDYQGYITVEQERDPRKADGSLRDLTASRAFLSRVGFDAQEVTP